MKIVIRRGTGPWDVAGPALLDLGHEGAVLCRASITRRTAFAGCGGTAAHRRGTAESRSDAAIRLAGRSVNCRYTPANLREMIRFAGGLDAPLGKAIAAAAKPPRVWLQISTATI